MEYSAALRCLVPISLVCLLTLSATAAEPTAQPRRNYSLTLSGGVSLGAYQAGFLYLVSEITKRDPTFDLHLVDGGHQELLVVGPGMTSTVDCEGAAERGEILLSHGAAAELDDAVLGPPGEHGRARLALEQAGLLADHVEEVSPEADEVRAAVQEG